jgi:hypothetical protein
MPEHAADVLELSNVIFPLLVGFGGSLFAVCRASQL